MGNGYTKSYTASIKTAITQPAIFMWRVFREGGGAPKPYNRVQKDQTTHYHISKHPKTSANALAIAMLYALTFLKLPKRPLGITKTPSPMYGPSPETVDTCSWRLPLSGEFWSNLVEISRIFMWNPPPASYLAVGVKDCEGGVENGWKGPPLALSPGFGPWNSIPHEPADSAVMIIFCHNIYIYIYACNIDPGKPAAEVSQT